ncbi:MAG: sulfurtransferase [Betaproteobacteria bacterium]
MNRLALFALLLAPLLALAKPLLTPAELAARLSDPQLRIVDIRAGREANGKSPYENGHIAGAQSAPYPQWRGPKDNPGKLLPAAQLSQLVQSLGVDRDTPAVVVFEGADATDFGGAARVAWTLRAGGVSAVSILNCGRTAWRSAGLPVTTEVVDALGAPFELKFDGRYLASRADVQQALGGSARLLDARPAEFFAGETKHAAARTPGTIRGAKNVDNTVWFKGDSAVMVDADEARRIARELGIADDGGTTVSFCNTGHWAATNWFVLSEVLGHKDVRLYPESMVDWSQAGLPMDNVPGRLAQFWMQIRQALAAN